MQFTITGYSTALFSTWYFIEELGLLFDAGDGLISSLLQKSRKINHVFISHADRDHLTGLLQFNQLNGRPGFPIIYYPRDSGSFPKLEEFSKKFDPHVSGTVWTPLTEQNEIRIKKDILIETIRNGHVQAAPDISKSLSYKVFQTKEKLKPAFLNLSGEEIRKIREGHGKESISMEVRTNIISYSGDTPVEDGQRWNNSQILIHEATFLASDKDTDIQNDRNKHSTLEEVMEMVSGINIEQLILGHFSSRYSPEQIDESIRKLCDKYAINIPVFRLLPGEVFHDILKGNPINR
jgi:ribonuclease Z